LVRIPLDANSGRLSATRDTVYTGFFTAFGVTADGGHLVLDEGTYDYDLWGLTFRDALRGEFPMNRRLVHSSSPFAFTMSPDARRLLIAREQNRASGFKFRLSIMPFEGGAESPLSLRGSPTSWAWSDSVTIALEREEAGRRRLSLVDVGSGAERGEFVPADSTPPCCRTAPLPGGGWAWIPLDGKSVRIRRPNEAEPRVFERPEWFANLTEPAVSSDGQSLLYSGGNATADSTRIDVLSVRDGTTVPWLTIATAEGVAASWLEDGSILLTVKRGEETTTFYRLRVPGQVDSLGTIPRPVWGVEVSPDLRRAPISTRVYHGDAWMYKVDRP